MTLEFFIPGIPRPGGSKRAIKHAVTGRVVTMESGKHTPAWRSFVRDAAAPHMNGRELLDGPIKLVVRFVFPRPGKHYRRTRAGQRILKPDAPHYHTIAPDTTKLLRALEDALKAVVWTDDSRVAVQLANKTYGAKPGAHITIEAIPNHRPLRATQPLLNGLAP